MGVTRRRRPGFPALVAAATLMSVAGTACSSGDGPSKTAIVYGDSLLNEAKKAIDAAAATSSTWTVTVRSLPGSAPCDWLHQLKTDLRDLHPQTVVLQTVGNAWTQCMATTPGHPKVIGSARYFDKYRGDLREFFHSATAAGTSVVFVAPVTVTAPGLQSALIRLESIAKEEAGRGNAVEITEAPRDAVTDRGRFVASLPCLTTETVANGCRRGQIPVREPAGLHFCPSGYASGLAVFAGCPEYSSGAYRFGRAVFKVATADHRKPRPVS